MKSSRRSFLQGLAAFFIVLFSSLSFLTGCNATTIFQTILAWIPTAEKAFAGIVTILGPFLPPGASAIIAEVNAAFQVVVAAVNEYLNAPAADKTTFLDKLRVALQAVSDQIQAFLNAINIPGNPIVAVVLGLAQVIISTIEGFLNNLPVPVGGKVLTMQAALHCSGATVVVVPKLRNDSSFKKDFNAICEANGQTSIEL
jgi:hypothetical protein